MRGMSVALLREVSSSTLNRLGARDLGEGSVTLSRGRGCPYCRETGYMGRTGIFELLEVNDPIRGLISQGASDTAIRHAAIESGMVSIGEDGLKKVLTGITTLDEVSRVVYLAESGVRICPTCGHVLAAEYDYCTSCGDFVGEHCEHCKRRVAPDWTVCPFCGAAAAKYEDLVTQEPGAAEARISSSAQRWLGNYEPKR
jgi:RNA polymerase subunit RPABC4/transcription elongation factor Spt4